MAKYIQVPIAEIDEKIGSKIKSAYYDIVVKYKLNAWIAGGFIRNCFDQNPSDKYDIDLFFTTKDEAYEAYETMYKDKWNLGFECTNSLSMNKNGVVVDLIKLAYPDPQACIESFDFTVCCGAFKDDKLFFHENFIEHIKTKTLEMNNKASNKGILKRYGKYLTKGFVATKDTMDFALSSSKKDKSPEKTSNKKGYYGLSTIVADPEPREALLDHVYVDNYHANQVQEAVVANMRAQLVDNNIAREILQNLNYMAARH